MAKQTEIDYESTEWADDSVGGTPITATQLNRMEGGIADACAAVDQLRTKRLPTYLVATGGDEATQDVYQEAILGPCLIVDLATATTYYDNGEDGEGHERTKLTSGADIDDLRDSLSQSASDDGDGFKLFVSGGVAYASYNGIIGGEYGRVNAPFSVPEWARPEANVSGALANQSVGAPGYVIVQTDGTVGAQAWGRASSTEWMGSVCWPVRRAR